MHKMLCCVPWRNVRMSVLYARLEEKSVDKQRWSASGAI